jgi:two-component SAPR family response regulator
VLTLLKAMIAMGGHEIPTARLIDALWPETEGDTGAETFHKTLQRLRRLLNHDGLIQIKENKVSLNRQVCWVDALAFDDLLNDRDSSDKRARGDTATWVHAYEQAVQLYRGHFLDGDETTWAQARQDRLHWKFLDATERLRVYWTELGDSTRTANMTRRMHEVEPAKVE